VCAALACLVLAPPASALNTLYTQEGTADDGYAAIDASGQGPTAGADDSADSAANWKYQYGGTATWSGTYSWDGDAWIEETETGDPDLDIEADIEMYASTSITDPKIYFHLGNIYTATDADKTATVSGTLTSNNGQYIGISFAGSSKDASNFETDGSGNYTGRIFDAMVGTVDVGGRDISTEAFDIVITMTWGAGYQVPDNYGDGAHSTITDTLWWLVDGGNPGSYNLTWKIVLEPETHQADGNYNLDPQVVAAPVL
jgi:hypothetical protein